MRGNKGFLQIRSRAVRMCRHDQALRLTHAPRRQRTAVRGRDRRCVRAVLRGHCDRARRGTDAIYRLSRCEWDSVQVRRPPGQSRSRRQQNMQLYQCLQKHKVSIT